MSTEIVRSQTPEEEELARKLAELAGLETELADRELDLATLLSELHIFERRYLRLVGGLYAELDELRAQIAEATARRSPHDARAQADATEARAQAEESAQTANEAQAAPPAPEFAPSESLKKLYWAAAKAIHPDLAKDEQERARRTPVMAQVNAAFGEGDENRLRAIIREWEISPEAVTGDGTGAELVRTIRKIAQVRARLDAIGKDIDRVRESPISELKVRVAEAESEGRDLLAGMAAALERQITEAREELARVRVGARKA